MMTRSVILAACFVGLSAPSVMAQEAPAPWTPPMQEDTPESGDESGALGGGLDGLMNDLMRELAPELDKLGDDMSGALSGVGPVLQNLGTLGEDLKNYQTPERLENGDILIRRKAGAPPPPPLGDGFGGFNSPDESSPDEPSAENPPADRFDRIPDVIPNDPNAPQYEL